MRKKLGKVKVKVAAQSLLLSGTLAASLLLASSAVQAATFDDQPFSMSWSNGTTQPAAITSTTHRDQMNNLEQTALHAQTDDQASADVATPLAATDDQTAEPKQSLSSGPDEASTADASASLDDEAPLPIADESLSVTIPAVKEFPDVWVNAYFEANGLQTLTLPGQGTYTTNDEGVVTFTPLSTFIGQTDTIRLIKESSTGKVAYINIRSVVSRTTMDRSADDSQPAAPEHAVGEPLVQPEKPTLTLPETAKGEPLVQPEKPTLTLPETAVGEPLVQPEKPTLTLPETAKGEPLVQPEKPTLTLPETAVGEPLVQPEKPTLTLPETAVGEPLVQPEKPTLTLPETVKDEPEVQPEKPAEPEPIDAGKAALKPFTQPTPAPSPLLELPSVTPVVEKVGGDLLVPSAQVAAFVQPQPVQRVEHLVTNAVVPATTTAPKQDKSVKTADKLTVPAKEKATVVVQAVEIKQSAIALIKAAINNYSDAIMAPNDQTPSADAADEIPVQHQNEKASVMVMAVLLAILGITGSVISSLAKKFLV